MEHPHIDATNTSHHGYGNAWDLEVLEIPRWACTCPSPHRSRTCLLSDCGYCAAHLDERDDYYTGDWGDTPWYEVTRI